MEVWVKSEGGWRNVELGLDNTNANTGIALQFYQEDVGKEKE